MNKMKFFTRFIICCSVLIISTVSSNVYADGFNPASNIERQDFAIIMARTLHLESNPAASNSATFSDVSTNAYSSQYIEAAIKSGLINDSIKEKFVPNTISSRQGLEFTFVKSVNN